MNLIFIVLFLVGTLRLHAAPQLISDNRLDEISASLAVGRGYGLGSNQVYGHCFEELKYVDPSFDLRYTISEIDEGYLDQKPGEVNSLSSYKKAFVRFHARFSEKIVDPNGAQREVPLRNLLLSLDVQSYYESFDELVSSLESRLLEGLKQGNFAGFAQDCGSHYIRTLGRQSSFMGLLTYRGGQGSYDDPTFAAELRRLITAFDEKAPIPALFQKEMAQRKLSFSTETIGIDKNTLSHIQVVPRSVDELRDTIRDLASSMQDEKTGRIGVMEIVPWTEHAAYAKNLTFPTTSAKDRYFAEKNLRDNNFIVGEIDRIDANLNDLIVRANQCARILEEKYPVGRDEFSYDPEKTWFVDLGDRSNPKRYKNLKELKSLINPGLVEKLRKQQDFFHLGSGSDVNSGALRCMENLDNEQMLKRNYRDVPACLFVETFKAVNVPVLDHYCLPVLVQ